MEPDRKTSGFCKAGSRKRFRLVFFGPDAIPRRARIRRNQTRDSTPHHHPLPVEGRPQPTCLRSVARTARKPTRPAREAPLTAMPAAPAVYRSAARASQLRLRVAPGSGQPAAPSALRGGRTLRLRCLSLAALRIHSLRSGHGLPGGWRAQGGSVPRGGAHSATADGLLRYHSRSRVVVGCGCPRDPHAGAASATPPRRRPRAPARPSRARERRPGSPRESEPATAPKPPAPAPQLSPQGSGRSRSHARVRVRVRRSVSAPHLGHPFIAPARPSSAPRGGTRAPAPLPGLRQRAPTRHRPRQIRQRTLCASPLPRPRRTTWHGTPSPA